MPRDGDADAEDPTSDASHPDAGADTAAHVDAAEDSGDECTPEELAEQTVGVLDTVNDGEVTVATQEGADVLTVDASSGGVTEAAENSFVYVDFDEPEKLAISDAEAFEGRDWDIAFRRTVIRINGGDSGPGAWMVSTIDSGWEGATDTPGRDAEWATDDFVTDDCELVTTQRGGLVTAFGQWYDYSPETHEVSAPESTTWAMYNMQTHKVVKLGISSYADGQYEVRIGQFE